MTLFVVDVPLNCDTTTTTTGHPRGWQLSRASVVVRLQLLWLKAELILHFLAIICTSGQELSHTVCWEKNYWYRNVNTPKREKNYSTTRYIFVISTGLLASTLH